MTVSIAPVLVLSIVYVLLLVDFVLAYLVVRLRLAWSRRTIVLVLALAGAVQLAGFLFLIAAGIRGWIP